MNTSKLLICFSLFAVLQPTVFSADTTSSDPIQASEAPVTSSVTLPPTESKALLSALTQRVIVPLYQTADKTATTLNQQVIRFYNAPTAAGLQQVRQAWSEALQAWEASEIALFGPALSKQRDLHIYFRPVKKRVIKRLLTQETPINMENLEFAGVGAQGFATLEYLLFDREKTDVEILAPFTTADSRQAQHLLAISTLLQRDISAIYNEWQSGYIDSVIHSENHQASEFANDQQALETVVGKVDQLAEAVINKLRNPLAKNAQLSGKDPQRENANAYKFEAWRSGHTLANMKANLRGIDLALTEGGILAWLEKSGGENLVQQYRSIQQAIAEIEFPSDDLFQQIEDKQLAPADALFDQVLALSKVIQAMAPKLGIQLGFNDSDGD